MLWNCKFGFFLFFYFFIILGVKEWWPWSLWWEMSRERQVKSCQPCSKDICTSTFASELSSANLISVVERCILLWLVQQRLMNYDSILQSGLFVLCPLKGQDFQDCSSMPHIHLAPVGESTNRADSIEINWTCWEILLVEMLMWQGL